MSFFDLFKQPDINQGVKEFLDLPGAVLLDVRSPEEYRDGHIPGSQNLPLPNIQSAEAVIADKELHLFVYCYSGARSHQASNALQRMGYSNVHNIGGIAAYSGKIER